MIELLSNPEQVKANKDLREANKLKQELHNNRLNIELKRLTDFINIKLECVMSLLQLARQ